MKKHSGFTLIELMVVMAIIAILATAGLTAYSNYLKKARDSARVQTARQIMTKVEELANGGPNPSLAQLIAFLEAENFAPVDLGSGLLKIDPLGETGRSCCSDVNCYSNGFFGGPCVFTYATMSDGTYMISYPVEHEDNVINIWQVDDVNASDIYGLLIGTSPHLVPPWQYAYYVDWLSNPSVGVTVTSSGPLSSHNL